MTLVVPNGKSKLELSAEASAYVSASVLNAFFSQLTATTYRLPKWGNHHAGAKVFGPEWSRIRRMARSTTGLLVQLAAPRKSYSACRNSLPPTERRKEIASATICAVRVNGCFIRVNHPIGGSKNELGLCLFEKRISSRATLRWPRQR